MHICRRFEVRVRDEDLPSRAAEICAEVGLDARSSEDATRPTRRRRTGTVSKDCRLHFMRTHGRYRLWVGRDHELRRLEARGRGPAQLKCSHLVKNLRESGSCSFISHYDHGSRSAHARGLCDSHGTRLPAKENFLWRKCPPLQILKVPRRGACKCQVPCVRDASIPQPKYAQGAHATS